MELNGPVVAAAVTMGLAGVGLVVWAASDGAANLQFVSGPGPHTPVSRWTAGILGGLLILVSILLGLSSESSASPQQSQSTPQPVVSSFSPEPPSSAPATSLTRPPTQAASKSPSSTNSPAGITPVALADIQPSRHAEDIDVQEVKFGGTDYGPTWIKSCIQTADGGPQYDTWDVSGYSKLTLTLGVPSDSPPNVGAAARFTFTDASGKELTPAFTVSASHQKTLTVPLTGVDDLTIGCIDEPGPKETSGGAVISFALGNATLR
jgi:hypothetical protein